MMFGGIFKVWFGGKAKARREAIAARGAAASAPSSTESGNQLPGVLAIDSNGDGVIDPATEADFKTGVPGATSALDGLKSYDSNSDSVLDADDPQFHKFGIWNDKNNDGKFQPGEFQALADYKIESIDLSAGLNNGLLSAYTTDGSEKTLALRLSSTFNSPF